MLHTEFQDIKLSVLEKKSFESFNNYGNDGHLGHVTKTNLLNLWPLLSRRFHIKFEFHCPSGFRKDV